VPDFSRVVIALQKCTWYRYFHSSEDMKKKKKKPPFMEMVLEMVA
jgi:hypothetical protein